MSSTAKGYHRYCGGCSELLRDTMNNVEGIQHSGDIISTVRLKQNYFMVSLHSSVYPVKYDDSADGIPLQ